jgi:hypothetical protein
MSPNTGSGGAATCHGIWYQALWCVLQAATARVLRAGDSSSENETDLQLILEPSGGDALLERPDHRRVVQLKTRSGGTWSLKQVVQQVLPDLYQAVDLGNTGEVSYEFVTEGGMGQWGQVRRFFESLGGRLPAGASDAQFSKAYEGLDDTSQMTFWWFARRILARGLCPACCLRSNRQPSADKTGPWRRANRGDAQEGLPPARRIPFHRQQGRDAGAPGP